MNRWIRYLLTGAVLAAAYLGAMYALGGWYWCGRPAGFNPLAPPIGRC